MVRQEFIDPNEDDHSDLEEVPSIEYFRNHAWHGAEVKAEPAPVRRSSDDGRQYVEQNLPPSGYTCRFVYGDSTVVTVLTEQRLLVCNEADFVARIAAVDGEFDLKAPFRQLQKDVLGRIVVERILDDDFARALDKGYEELKGLLAGGNAGDLFELSLVLEERHRYTFDKLLEALRDGEGTSGAVKEICRSMLIIRAGISARNKFLPNCSAFYRSEGRLEELGGIYRDAVAKHRDALLRRCPCGLPSLVENLEAVSYKRLLYVTENDVKLFSGIADVVDLHLFRPFVDRMQDSMFSKIQNLKYRHRVSDAAPLTCYATLFLLKSFQETLMEISRFSGVPVETLLSIDDCKLGKLPEAKKCSLLERCMFRQVRFIFELLMHFMPGKFSPEKPFQYNYKFIDAGTIDRSVPEDRLVWSYLLDDAIAKPLSKEYKGNVSKIQKRLQPLLVGYMDFLRRSDSDSFESLRVITHGIVGFAAQTSAYAVGGESRDHHVLNGQMEFMASVIRGGGFSHGSFRDVVEVFNEFWKNRKDIVERLRDTLAIRLLDLASGAVQKSALCESMSKFFRSLNEFVTDVGAVDFGYLVKEKDTRGHDPEIFKPIGDKGSYLVVDEKKFLESVNGQGGQLPEHYLNKTLDDFLSLCQRCLYHAQFGSDEQLNCTGLFMTAIRSTLVYLKEQANYECFDTFKAQNTRSFAKLLDTCTSADEFADDVRNLKETLWYIRKQDEISPDKALSLYKELNKDGATDTLSKCYERYSQAFDAHINDTIRFSPQETVRKIADGIKLTESNFDEWTEKFKTETVPTALAGLAAVYSVLRSRKFCDRDQLVRPHCIQIFCVLMLLGVNKSNSGVDKHLAQVLTGQGKSLVLGLLSALLALTGHRVRAVCYSEYLSKRDRRDFSQFFKSFGIDDKISYGTIEEMASEMFHPVINGEKTNLTQAVLNRVLSQEKRKGGKIECAVSGNSVLLIDEVDVFFNEHFYGSVYGSCYLYGRQAFAEIQQKIWELVQANHAKAAVTNKVKDFVEGKIRARADDFVDFNRCLTKSEKFVLPVPDSNDELILKSYRFDSLYEEHLEKMIDTAINVGKGTDDDWFIKEFRIGENGRIMKRLNIGGYSENTYNDYYNAFNYLRLKKSSFEHRNYNNYGYLIIDCGRISYAKLPEDYPLILGVSGTLVSLLDYEKATVQNSYDIRRFTYMPSYFGRCNLRFNTTTDVDVIDTEDEWRRKIFRQVNANVAVGRSVLVFFEDEVALDKFQGEFCGRFDRMNVLTENTDGGEKDRFVEEAGFTRCVTLATRGMGRGVDYSTSNAVESGGGVHVVQTFFSEDVKEETQIKGRTARKDNKGSYELVLCKKHLVASSLADNDDRTVTYESLNAKRIENISQKGNKLLEKIKKHKKDHEATIKYYRTMFEG